MKENRLLTAASLLAILLFTFHITDDVVRGFEPGGFKNINVIVIGFTWLFGTVILAGRRSGYIIVLLGSLLGCVVPLAHMRGAGFVGGRVANTSGMFFFVWTMLALGVTSLLCLFLSVRGLWNLRRSKRLRVTD